MRVWSPGLQGFRWVADCCHVSSSSAPRKQACWRLFSPYTRPCTDFLLFASFWYSSSSSYLPTSSVCFSSAFLRTASFEHSTTFCSNFYLHIPYQTHNAQRGQGVGKTKTEKDSQWPRWTSRFLPWRLDFPDLRSLSLARYICHTWGSLEKPMDNYDWKLWYMSFWNPHSLLWLSHLLWLFKNPLPLAQISKKKKFILKQSSNSSFLLTQEVLV